MITQGSETSFLIKASTFLSYSWYFIVITVYNNRITIYKKFIFIHPFYSFASFILMDYIYYLIFLNELLSRHYNNIICKKKKIDGRDLSRI